MPRNRSCKKPSGISIERSNGSASDRNALGPARRQAGYELCHYDYVYPLHGPLVSSRFLGRRSLLVLRFWYHFHCYLWIQPMSLCIGNCGKPDQSNSFIDSPYICLDCWRAGWRWRFAPAIKVIEGKRYPTYEAYKIPQDNIVNPAKEA